MRTIAFSVGALMAGAGAILGISGIALARWGTREERRQFADRRGSERDP